MVEAPKVTVGTAHMEAQDANNLALEPGVISIVPSMPMRLIAPLSNSTLSQPCGDMWGIRAVGANSSPFDGQGVTVAILDTGIDKSHPAFEGVEIVEENFTSEVGEDINGHGTHCAATVFGRAVEGLRIGVAPGVQRALIGKVISKEGGTSAAIVRAIQWALDGGANVISLSLGIDFPGLVKEKVLEGFPVELAVSMALQEYAATIKVFEAYADVVKTSASLGKHCILVAAAGNESQMDQRDDFKIAVSPPAASEGFLSVAAISVVNGKYRIAPFSNTGARVSGPGVDILSAKLGGGLTRMSGTSMAAPHIAGVAALWAQKLKASGHFTARRLSDRLVGSGTLDGFASGFDPQDVGVGTPQAPLASSGSTSRLDSAPRT